MLLTATHEIESKILAFKIPFNTIVTVSNADMLIQSNKIYTGDGQSMDDFNSLEEQVLACLTYKYDDCGEYFIKHCVENGIEHPVIFILNEEDRDEGDPLLWRSVNGHHRFSVAWKHNLSFPAVFCKDYGSSWEFDPDWNKVKVHSHQRTEV